MFLFTFFGPDVDHKMMLEFISDDFLQIGSAPNTTPGP